ncbi:hypothetical protein ACVTYA_14955, partial [Enterococcus hirae]
RSRMGEDTAKVVIGASEEVLTEQKVMVSGQEWKKYSGTYKVPEGQTKTRIQFDSISTAGNRPHIGNEVDYVVFTNKRATVTIKY